ncbi:methyltransferase domain-containing protein [Pseudotenacibaculum sp. MALMAid0570]|uniref:class I SAM-dependent methyltransferase n=1 Tax=Pseudotenacibaculum sp. MALMAid0570 TaxID=3143938 RepID=UPI0032DFC157
MAKNIVSEFDDFSKNYTQDMVGCVPHYLELISSFAKHLPDHFNPKRILDLGCGNGNVTAQLVSRFPNAVYTLLDASSEMIELCSQRFKDYHVNYEQKFFHEFSFEENSYDLVVAGFSIHHCNEKEKQELFQKIHHSLEEGGFFLCSDLMMSKSNPNHPSLLKEWEAFVKTTFSDGQKWTWLMDHYEDFDKPTDYTKQIAWLQDVGFTSIQLPFQEECWVHFQARK